MSSQLETTTLYASGDYDRQVEHEQKILAFREQLDSRLAVPDLTPEQRNHIITAALRRLERFVLQEQRLAAGSYNYSEPETVQSGSFPESPLGHGSSEIYTATSWLATIEDPSRVYDGRISAHHAQSLKYYSGTLFEAVRAAEAMGDDNVARELTGVLYSNYFSASPCIASYTGGAAGQIELLAYAERSEYARSVTANLSGEIFFDNSFTSDSKVFAEIISGKPPISQLGLINTASRLAREAVWQGDWAEPFSEKVYNELLAMADPESKASPFVRIAAAVKANEVYDELHAEWVDIVELDPEEQVELIENDRQWREQEALRQQVLHGAFPSLGDGYLMQLSSAAAAVVNNGHIDSLATIEGEQVRLSDIDQRNDLLFSVEDADLLRALHNPAIRQAVEAETGIDLNQISLDTQLHLLSFMVEADADRYKRLLLALNAAGEHRLQLAEAFLATKYGRDYGNSLLLIAEHAPAEHAAQIFDTINKLRHRSREFSEMFAMIDPELPERIENAINESITSAITSLRVVAVNGSLREDVSPGMNSTDYIPDGSFDATTGSIEEAIEILNGLERTFGIPQEILHADDLRVFKLNEDDEQFVIYRFISEQKGNFLMQLRREGAYGYDPAYEYGNAKGVEATAGLIVDSEDPRSLLMPKDSRGVSIRFDREGRRKDEAPNSSERDPTRGDGIMSVDISSIMGREDTMARRIGRFIAAGNRIRSREMGTADSLHHNTNFFDQEKYGSSSGFAHFTDEIIRMCEGLRSATSGREIAKMVLRNKLKKAA